MMFTCDKCSRNFKTRTSLTRHARNHSGQGGLKHVCGICHVSYARRDVLQRHVERSHASGSSRTRKRCHTACDACRLARIKCDGNLPCVDCSINGRACYFPPASTGGRVSRTAHTDTTSPHQEDSALRGNSNDGNASLDDTDLPSPTSSAAAIQPTALESLSDHDSVAIESLTTVMNVESLMFAQLAEAATTTWPWLHESLYLQDGPLFDLTFDEVPVAPLQGSQPEAVDYNILNTDIETGNDSLNDVVEDLVIYAASSPSSANSNTNCAAMWTAAASRLVAVQGSRRSVGGSSHLLDSFVERHMSNFNPLWPLLSADSFNAARLQPVLYLTLTSIGAMYGSRDDRRYGTLMHERLRRLLTAALFDLEGGQDDLVWLSLSRLLTQVAALYFGQKQAFSYAQHLGAILAAQARRMNLFSNAKSSVINQDDGISAESDRSVWMSAEQRRRLAFGIMRADVFTSILLGTRPYLAYEEVTISLPRSDTLWHNDNGLSAEQLLVAQHFEDQQARWRFVDLIHLALEENEDLPELSAVGFELCLFGLQGSVWSNSQDTTFLNEARRRYASSDRDESSCSTGKNVTNTHLSARTSGRNVDLLFDDIEPAYKSDEDAFATVIRPMDDLQRQYTRVIAALDSWYCDMRRGRPGIRRDTRMSSMLLYHINHLQLSAPLQSLHHVSYATMEGHCVDNTVAGSVQKWISSNSSSVASTHAWSIWSLIRDEQQREADQRSRFNFLAFCGLHHAAVVLWTLRTTRPGERSWPANIAESNVQQILLECAEVFDMLSPLGGASFGTAARKLASRSFPTTQLAHHATV